MGERDGRYGARVAVPVDLRPCSGGKTGPRMPLAAKRRAVEALPRYDVE